MHLNPIPPITHPDGQIENPFNLDKNDLNLGYYCRAIIAKELDAITAQTTEDPLGSIFTAANRPLGCNHPAADQLVQDSITEARSRLAWRRRSHGGPGASATTPTSTSTYYPPTHRRASEETV